jgi:hypothetical protein
MHRIDYNLGLYGYSFNCSCGYFNYPYSNFRSKEEAEDLARLHLKMIEKDASEESDRKSGAW